ncbi:MAG: indole-3-glycerol-phosphate synthase TrpC, partial [Acaryochloridaceae cyanobacterium CSU_5_19]|nr:indole-3-glycerol-phosphate synthase TrpC [Acaryochloridaceae cyanobacterium CSU_5_19]
ARGADAVLLITAILSDQDLTYFLKIIQAMGMVALVEVHTQAELDRVIQLPGVALVGINNRNLETFGVDLQVTCDLLAQSRQSLGDRNILVVSESGLHTAEDVAQVKAAGAKAILVGESLIRDTDDQASSCSEPDRMRAKISALFSGFSPA